jgi:hypothetical protein
MMIPQFWTMVGPVRVGRLLLMTVVVAAASTRPAAAAESTAANDITKEIFATENAMKDIAPSADVPDKTARAIGKLTDPLKGTPQMPPEKTGQAANTILAKMLKPRSDSWADWNAPLEPLHRCGEPRALPPCVPPPPCHPSLPPSPYDLVGMQGTPSCGPIYGGPCEPRTGTHDDGPHPRIHRIHDRMFDWFYTPRTPILP